MGWQDNGGRKTRESVVCHSLPASVPGTTLGGQAQSDRLRSVCASLVWNTSLAVCGFPSYTSSSCRLTSGPPEVNLLLRGATWDGRTTVAGRQGSLWSATVSRPPFLEPLSGDKRSLAVCGQSALRSCGIEPWLWGCCDALHGGFCCGKMSVGQLDGWDKRGVMWLRIFRRRGRCHGCCKWYLI